MSQRTHQRYTSEFKEQALGLLSLGKPVAEVAQELQISSNLLYAWRSQSQRTQSGSAGQRAVGEQSEADALRALRRENARLQAENDILKSPRLSSAPNPRPTPRNDPHYCTEHRPQRAAHLRESPSAPQQLLPCCCHHREPAQMSQVIGTIFHQHRRRYGYRCIWKQLAADGIICAPDRVRRLMQEQGLIAIQPKTYVPQTSDGRADLPSPNLLLDQPMPTQPNEVWAGDITFIPCGEKWLYLAVVIELCSRRIVGWALADHLRGDLVVEALKQAIAPPEATPPV